MDGRETAPGRGEPTSLASLMDLAREMPHLDAHEARRRLDRIGPEARALVYRIVLALGLPWHAESGPETVPPPARDPLSS